MCILPGDEVAVRDKTVPFVPIKGKVEAIYNGAYQILFGAPNFRLVWVDGRKYDISKVDRYKE